MPDFSATDAAIVNVLGEDVTYTPNGGGAVVVKGFFQSPDDEPDTADLDFIANEPQVILQSADATAPNKADLFTIRGQNYRVKDFEQDEENLVVFHLLETT
jgi:hypothetical protein